MIPEYRCASCGSPNVIKDTQTGGIKYNYLKGAIGTVALGVGGAVAGFANDKQEVFKCPDCGMTLTFSLGEPWKSLIDLGNSSIDARKNLNYDGIPVEWKFLKEKYPNIEEGIADSEVQSEKEFNGFLVESTKRKEAETIENVRKMLKNCSKYIESPSNNDYTSNHDLLLVFGMALYYTIQEYGGEICYKDEDGVYYYEELLRLLEIEVGCKIDKNSHKQEPISRQLMYAITIAKNQGYEVKAKKRINNNGKTEHYYFIAD